MYIPIVSRFGEAPITTPENLPSNVIVKDFSGQTQWDEEDESTEA